jgi:hypothetical protein
VIGREAHVNVVVSGLQSPGSNAEVARLHRKIQM